MENEGQKKPVIGWIGTGVMGKSMCGHLLKAGYTLNVFNRTKEKTDDLVKEGAHWMEPQELAKNSDVVILMLGYPRDVEDMTIGSKGILEHMKKGYV
jgi:3-hydroxyisobutyrate dehydrogenase